ncbi:MAG TPA: lamin tail domain-containing protein, partial [Verrucomicrobiae bacterium]|nr:lamin tail domain-containing protein [Verrucomicrobiae bacterium]
MNKLIQTTGNLLAAVLITACFHSPVHAGVVINEIFYHAPNDFDDLEWVELHNPDAQAVNLAGWKLTGGIEFNFPASTTIPANGFLVLSKDAKLFGEFYDVPVAGEFKKSLSNGGDTLELVDAAGAAVDRVVFEDSDPWPTEADGHSASLERITPGIAGDRADNWSASPLPEDEAQPAGTPGQANASFFANFPPVIRDLVLSSSQPLPGESVRVSATVEDDDGVGAVELRYRVVHPGAVGDEQVMPMKSTDGKNFSAELPGQADGSLVRLRVHATDREKSERYYPSPNELRPAVSVFVQARPDATTMPVVQMIHADAREFAEMERVRRRSLGPGSSRLQTRERNQLMNEFNRAFDLRELWFEWSINRPLDGPTYRALRKVIAAKQSERNAFIEEAAAAPDVEVFNATAPGRMK